MRIREIIVVGSWVIRIAAVIALAVFIYRDIEYDKAHPKDRVRKYTENQIEEIVKRKLEELK